MLNKKYRYVGLDFETTGLDPSFDEPIQIGIVEIDVQGNIIDTFQSFIKPSKKIDELKNIVSFITGFSLSDFENAPSCEALYHQISHFFGENVVIIGHNVQFDLDFLKKYFPSLSFAFAIDTFQLAQVFVHYAPSYALEVLIEYLKQKNSDFLGFLQSYGLLEAYEKNFHDALYDTKHALVLYRYFMFILFQLCQKYPDLIYFVQQENSYFSKIFVPPSGKLSFFIKFPPLEKISPSFVSPVFDKNLYSFPFLKHLEKYYVGNVSIKELLQILLSKKNSIFCFSHLQKLEIAKEILYQLGIKNIGYIKEDQSLDKKKFEQFLNKKIFSHEEVLFIIKYLSHHYRGYGTLDLNSSFDHKIYAVIKNTKPCIKYPFVLATHASLFSLLPIPDHPYKDYSIFFFDVEQRYKSYHAYLSRPYDLYYTLNFLETLLYKQNINSQLSNFCEKEKFCFSGTLEKFYQFFQLFIGELFIETKRLFLNVSQNFLQHDPIIDHSDFYKTNLYLKKIPHFLEDLKEEIEEHDFLQLSNQIAHMFSVFDSVVTITKKMYNQSDFFFVYSDSTKFTSWNEFTDIFKNSTVYFFSNTNKQYHHLFSFEKKSEISILDFNENFDKLLEYVFSEKLDNKSIFIVSTQKEQSKKIFEDFYQKGIHNKFLLLIENITGGIGKNIFKAKQKNNGKILIGGYNFLLSAYANAIFFDEILIFNINGPNKQQILDDIIWYAFN